MKISRVLNCITFSIPSEYVGRRSRRERESGSTHLLFFAGVVDDMVGNLSTPIGYSIEVSDIVIDDFAGDRVTLVDTITVDIGTVHVTSGDTVTVDIGAVRVMLDDTVTVGIGSVRVSLDDTVTVDIGAIRVTLDDTITVDSTVRVTLVVLLVLILVHFLECVVFAVVARTCHERHLKMRIGLE